MVPDGTPSILNVEQRVLNRAELEVGLQASLVGEIKDIVYYVVRTIVVQSELNHPSFVLIIFSLLVTQHF